ncbi:MAG: hypothetical protein Q4G36_10105 [Paracoccus sp. (in: a-proteobacteria)]|nr:hypothetical protein [Paracoccus sp. (in: a-proteobacteria)]
MGETVLIRCGESVGTTYVFGNQRSHTGNGGFFDDGMDGGNIILVSDSVGPDIRFHDTVGQKSYRDDGATVQVHSSADDRFVIVTAAHRNYFDVYTFDVLQREVAWTSAKIGPFMARSGLMRASCN